MLSGCVRLTRDGWRSGQSRSSFGQTLVATAKQAMSSSRCIQLRFSAALGFVAPQSGSERCRGIEIQLVRAVVAVF